MTNQDMLSMGVWGAQFDFPKTFSNPLFSCVTVLRHQYLITKHIII